MSRWVNRGVLIAGLTLVAGVTGCSDARFREQQAVRDQRMANLMREEGRYRESSARNLAWTFEQIEANESNRDEKMASTIRTMEESDRWRQKTLTRGAQRRRELTAWLFLGRDPEKTRETFAILVY